jgi:hypothetical protein
MKTIQPVSVWFNGNEVQATVLSSSCIYDNLSTSAQFSYQLIQVIVNPENPYMEQLTIVANGTLLMDGETYQNWETNDYAYDWVAEQLNLTITGPYVPPTPPTPSTTSTTTTEVPATTTTSTTTISSK